MKISFLPKSRLGNWAVGLSIFFLLVAIFFYIFAERLHVITSDMLVTIFGATSIIASVIAFFIGVVAIIKNKERSVLVFLAIFIGFVVLAFIIGDILGFPDV
ncbi:hypothetical protein LGK95_02370 [Clostridium algoriphilum]|uniref:hypothetical protein n=1 Tax=Clostridium algoriphilum TaxID=198347 RepID=UPI001CF5287E|nr:hypothetical protein [Clostridium algoriphilum]MCB2292384.1 hypothetical protein [Clostridium algoriphilum]